MPRSPRRSAQLWKGRRSTLIEALAETITSAILEALPVIQRVEVGRQAVRADRDGAIGAGVGQDHATARA